MTSRLLFLLALCLAGLAQLRAQAPAADGRLHFRTLGWRVSTTDLFIQRAGQAVPIVVTDTARSPFYAHERAERIVLYRLVPGPENKPVPAPIAQVDVSAAGDWPLLVFLPAPEGSPQPYRVVALADDLRSFPAPASRFINLTQVELKASLGDQRFTLAPRGMHQVDPGLKPDSAPETRYAAVAIEGPTPRLLYGNNWVVRPTQRTLVIIFAQDGAMQINRLVDDVLSYALPAPSNSPRPNPASP
jgi:hypothetical protein